MKKWLALLAASVLLMAALFTSCTPSEEVPEVVPVPESLKILCVGNSFSADTIEYVADIALAIGVEDVYVGNLYIGGCSISKHYDNAMSDARKYEYYFNGGAGWAHTNYNSMGDVIESEEWDWISIQHGTADGSRYAEVESYEDLPALVEYIREHAHEDTQIAFNMTWVGEPGSHEELISYGNNQLRYYNDIAALTRDTVAVTEGIDKVSPTGTAVQNARTSDVKQLTRDKYHLSEDIGRYIAGLTFFKALTGVDISEIDWAPEGVSEYEKQVAIESANNAVETPYEVTDSVLDEDDVSEKNTDEATE